MSKFDHVPLLAATHANAALPQVGPDPAGEPALSFDAALDKAAADIARGLFPPHAVPVVSLAVLAFTAFEVALYFAR